ncbi:MAG: hypothetical protein AAGA26_02905 [Pseudomonadota bacterium]
MSDTTPLPHPIPHVLDQLEDIPLERRRPLLAVDADEVLVHLAAHLKRFLNKHGIELRLTEYKLEGTMFLNGSDHPLPFDESLGWLGTFFDDEVLRQEALPNAPEVLLRLSEIAQIMVLTNVPKHGRDKRIENLKGLGLGYPLVENAGGKGAALAWMQRKIDAPVIFIDDSPNQIRSAKKIAPSVTCIHFAGAEMVAHLIPPCAEADHRVTDWLACEALIWDLLRSDEARSTS